MPSNARKNFSKRLLPDVASLIQTHRDVNPDGHGRRALGHITRSGVVMLCAAWELYIENLVAESVEFLTRDAQTPDFLPDRVKGKIAQTAKNDQHAHGALRLCGDGWKSVYRDAARRDTEKLNAPKFGNINNIFFDWLAIPDISVNWRHPREELNRFVELRGEIAHRGAEASYVRITRLVELKNMIDDLSLDVDRTLSDYLRSISVNGARPWNR